MGPAQPVRDAEDEADDRAMVGVRHAGPFCGDPLQTEETYHHPSAISRRERGFAGCRWGGARRCLAERTGPRTFSGRYARVRFLCTGRSQDLRSRLLTTTEYGDQTADDATDRRSRRSACAGATGILTLVSLLAASRLVLPVQGRTGGDMTLGGRHVFVLGAGASAAAAGAPLGDMLVWRYPAQCGLAVPVIDGVPDTSGEDSRFASYQVFLHLAETYWPDLCGLVDQWKRRAEYIFFPSGIGKQHYVDELLLRLQEHDDRAGVELVRRLIFEHIVGTTFDRDATLYRDFAQRILHTYAPSDVAIISFNFDFLLHEFFDVGVYFDYQVDFDWMDHNRRQSYRERDSIPMIKLNGSFDWGMCAQCGRLHLYFPHMFSHDYDDRACSLNCGGCTQPLIVLPHEGYGAQFNSLWASAGRLLSAANKVTIIGYSFPEYDRRVVALFRGALPANAAVEVVDIVPYGRDLDVVASAVRDKYRRLFPHLQEAPKALLDGFEGYVG